MNPLQEFEKVTEELYSYVISRDNGLCQICGKAGEHVHHIEYKSHQGKNCGRNLITLCMDCHTGKFGIHGCVDKTIVTILKEKVLRNERQLKEKLL